MVSSSFDEEKLLPLTGLHTQILTVLAAGNYHGYAISQMCTRESQGQITPAPGALYAALGRLDQLGYIALVEELSGSGSPNKRRIYEITATGKLVLGWEADRLLRVAHLAHQRLKV